MLFPPREQGEEKQRHRGRTETGYAIRVQGGAETGGGGGRSRRGEVPPARLEADKSPKVSEKELPVLELVISNR